MSSDARVLRGRRVNSKRDSTMAAKKRPTHPRIFTNVLQAISDLRDVKGSTVRKIVDKLRATTGAARTRNVALEVRRALEHGVISGVLTCKAGKYKLSFVSGGPGAHYGSDLCKNADGAKYTTRGGRKGRAKKRRVPRGRKCTPKKRKPRRSIHQRKKPCEAWARDRSSSGGGRRSRGRFGDSKSRSVSYRQSSDGSRTSLEECPAGVKIAGRPRREAWGVTKTRKVERPAARCKRPRGVGNLGRKVRRPKRLQRKPSPEPTDPNTDDNQSEPNNEDTRENANESEAPDNNEQYQQQGLVPYIDYNQDEDVPVQECDNPHCLCKLKIEPDDDSAM